MTRQVAGRQIDCRERLSLLQVETARVDLPAAIRDRQRTDAVRELAACFGADFPLAMRHIVAWSEYTADIRPPDRPPEWPPDREFCLLVIVEDFIAP